jgi:spermidine synthase
MTHPDRKDILVFAFFFSSGFAALLYQVVWLKYLNLLFGSTTYATAAVLSAFMFGLSIGSWLAPRMQTLYKSPIRSYGLLEIGVGIFALLFPPIYFWLKVPFGFLFNAAGPESFWYSVVTFLIAFAVLSLPTLLMGASLPLLARFMIHDNEVGSGTGTLYAINTAGAVAGILCAAFILIPLLGLKATIYAGAVINLSVGLICFLWGSRQPQGEQPLHETQPEQNRQFLLYLYAISGMLAIGYEVLWTRILVLHFGNSVYAYAIMLSVFLLGISLGSFAVGKWIDKMAPRPDLYFGFIQILWALSILLQLWQFSFLSDTLYSLARSFGQIGATTHFFILFAGAFQILFLPTFLSGALFPLIVKKLWQNGIRIEKAVSLSYSYNTVGGIFGSVLATFILIPALGTQGSMIAFAAANLLIGISILSVSPAAKVTLILRIAVIAIFGTAAFLVQKNIQVLHSAGIFKMDGEEKLISLDEDISATISVEDRAYLHESYRSLSVNGVNVAGSSPPLVAIQKMQGNLPMLLFGPTKKKDVLHIGFGSGGTAYSVSLYPETSITVVELSRSVVRSADQNFRSENKGIVNSGNVEFIYFDGRSFLQNTQRSFDVILSDSVHPRFSGNGSLYTKDYYELVYDRLRSGGVHSQWIPIYSLTEKNLKEILRAFVDVFPETHVWYINSTINPYIIVTGMKDSRGVKMEYLREAMSIPAVKEDLSKIGVYDEYFILDYFLFGPGGSANYTETVYPHIDDLMSVEYESSRLLNRQGSWLVNFRELLNHMEPVTRHLAGAESLDQSLMQRFQRATEANLQGQLLFIAGKLEESKHFFQQAQSVNVADKDPYEYSRIGF